MWEILVLQCGAGAWLKELASSDHRSNQQHTVLLLGWLNGDNALLNGMCSGRRRFLYTKHSKVSRCYCLITVTRWLDLQPVDIKSRWKHNWKSAQVVNSHLVCDATIRQPVSTSLCWTVFTWNRDTAVPAEGNGDLQTLCPCGETQTMSHIVESCPPTKLNGGLSRLHSADEDAISWLTNYGSWHAYEKKKTVTTGTWLKDITHCYCLITVTRLKVCSHS